MEERHVTTFEIKVFRIYGYMREETPGSLRKIRYKELYSLISTPNIIIITTTTTMGMERT